MPCDTEAPKDPMHCPFCQAKNTQVKDSRLVTKGDRVRRRRQCLSCTRRFTTYETPELPLPEIVKRDGQFRAYEEGKLRQSLKRALKGRKVSDKSIHAAIARIEQALRTSGEPQVPSSRVGELAMEALRDLDEVAFDRYATIQRGLQEAGEREAELLEQEQMASREGQPDLFSDESDESGDTSEPDDSSEPDDPSESDPPDASGGPDAVDDFGEPNSSDSPDSPDHQP